MSTKKEEIVSPKSRNVLGAWTPTERDFEIVLWVLLHGLMTSEQIRQVWFRRLEDGEVVIATQQATSKVMSRLVAAGFLVAERVLHRGPVVYRATAAGARFVGSKLRPAKVDLADLRHDLAVVDLWIGLVVGSRNPAGIRWITERQIRDRIRPGMSIGRIPDSLVVGPGGERWAIELETSSKDAKRYERIHHAYADRHRTEIPAQSPGWTLGEQLDDYVASGGRIDAVVWFFESERVRERAEKAAQKVLGERARSYRQNHHIRMSFQLAPEPGLPPFSKWQDQQRRERERREEARRREETERERRELAERHAKNVERARDCLSPREQQEAVEAAKRRNWERGGGYVAASQQDLDAALIETARVKHQREKQKEQQKQRRKESLRRLFGGSE